MNVILSAADISTIFLNGGKAYELFLKYCGKNVLEGGHALVKLPSTSPANAAWSLEKLTESWTGLIRQNSRALR